MKGFKPYKTPTYPDRLYKNELGDPFIVTKIIIREIYQQGAETQEEADQIIEEVMDQWEEAYLLIWEARQAKEQPENIGWCG
jgi:hypothetical protein